MPYAIALFVFLVAFGGKKTVEQVSSFYKWDSLIKKEAAKGKIPWEWIKAIMIVESDLGRAKSVAHGLKYPNDIEKSKSSDGKSWGLMQVTLGTAQMFEANTTKEDLNNPETSVRLAVKYLNWLYSKNKNEEWIVRAYNGGAGWQKTKLGTPLTKIYWEKYLKAKAKV